jgi:hypothetical protein
MGRPRINGENEQVMARFPAGTLDRIKAALIQGEKQADFIRSAVEAELQRRDVKP